MFCGYSGVNALLNMGGHSGKKSLLFLSYTCCRGECHETGVVYLSGCVGLLC